MTALANEFLSLLYVNDQGLSDSSLQETFGSRYLSLADVINVLLSANRIQVFHNGSENVYRAVKEETASKLEGLVREHILVYQVCEKAGNKGIWKQDISKIECALT